MSDALIEVRIRHANEVRAVRFCSWPVTDLDALIPTIDHWGLSASGVDDVSDTVCGQFVVNETGAYFELMYGDEEE